MQALKPMLQNVKSVLQRIKFNMQRLIPKKLTCSPISTKLAIMKTLALIGGTGWVSTGGICPQLNT